MLNRSKNRTFNYTPRFSTENTSNVKDENSSERDFVSKWKEGHEQKRKVKTALSITTLIVLLVLLLIGMFVLDSYIE